MRLYYFDDAGQRGRESDEPYFVLGGFGIDAEQIPVLRQAIRLAAQRYGFPLEYPSELKFHHVGVTKNRPGAENWMIQAGLEDRNQRRALVYSCLREALRVPSVSVLAVAVEKSELAHGEAPIVAALHPLLERVHMQSFTSGHYAMVALDEERAADAQLRARTRDGSLYMQFTRLLDTISFMPSEETLGVQLADLIVGAIGRYLNYGDAGYARLVWPYLRRDPQGDPNGWGIKRYPRGLIYDPVWQPTPWPPTDRAVHDIEMARAGQPFEWWANGVPSLTFALRPDVVGFARGS